MTGTDGHIHAQTSMKYNNINKCSICGEQSDGFHFGAEACRACAAFFRRSVSLGKKYFCRGDGKCELTTSEYRYLGIYTILLTKNKFQLSTYQINSTKLEQGPYYLEHICKLFTTNVISPDVRCICRACRYAQCIQVGMNPSCVQPRRDTIPKRVEVEPLPILSLKIQGDEPSSSSPSYEAMPTLERMRLNYSKMESSRLVIHRREGESLFMPRTPRNITYKEAAMVAEREMALVIDWVTCCFDEFANLPCDQKQVLLRSFCTSFMMLEGAYFCHINNRDDVIIIASGDYINMKNLHEFYIDYENPEVNPMVSPEEAVNMFKKSFDINRKSLIHPMMQQNVDVYEFFVLCTCALWDFGLDEQSDECVEVGISVKEKVFKELLFYLQNIKKVEEPSIRIAMLVTLLPAFHRSVRKLQEDVEVSNVFNIYAVPQQFYKIINGKF